MTMNEVHKMHKARQSDERLEIAAYVHRHHKIDETNYELVRQTIQDLHTSIEERKKARRLYGIKPNSNDTYLLEEYIRLSEVSQKLGRELGRF